MSVLIELLRKHSDELEHRYGAQIGNDACQAIAAMLRCKTEQQGRSQWFCSHCQHHDRLPSVPAPYHFGLAGTAEAEAAARTLLYGNLHLTLSAPSTGSLSSQSTLSGHVLSSLKRAERLRPSTTKRRARLYHRAAYP